MDCDRLQSLIKGWYIQVQDEALAPARMVAFMQKHIAECPVCLLDPVVKAEVDKITAFVLPPSKAPKVAKEVDEEDAEVAETEEAETEEVDDDAEESDDVDDEEDEEEDEEVAEDDEEFDDLDEDDEI